MSGKITGRLRFRYDDGSFIEWSTKEPKSAEEMHKLIDQWVRFGEPAEGASGSHDSWADR